MDQLLKLWYLLSAFVILTSGQELNQETLDYIAKSLQIRFEVVDNLANGMKTFIGEITMTNTGGRPVPAAGWILHFTHFNLVEPSHYPYPDGVLLAEQGVRFRHFQGCCFSMEPDKGFEPIPPNGGTRKVKFLSENAAVARTDILPNWYLMAPGLQPRTVANTAGEKLDWVEKFSRPNQWKRYDFKLPDGEAHDRYDPYIPSTRYAVNQVKDLGGPKKPVLPTPAQMTLNEDRQLQLNTRDWGIYAPDAFRREAVLLGERLGVNVVETQPVSRAIVFKMANIRVKVGDRELSGPEAYSLTVSPAKDVIEIGASSARGAFYGAMSLLNLKDDDEKVPEVSIVDAPRFEYRGFMLDVARNFHPVADVLRLLDVMAQYKINRLHLHLSDDEGWRIEISDLPDLTEVGSRRCHDLQETSCLLPFLGSGPSPTPRGSGYYTVQDYKDILLYAAQRHIQVIPEVDMPGHAHAAIRAMEARKNRLKALNGSESQRFSLVEEGDPSVYKSVQMFTDNAINPCLNSTYSFITEVVSFLKLIHQDVQPLKVFHFGGDEVAKGAWLKSLACKELLESDEFRQKKYTDLKEYFGRQVSNITESQGLDLAAWEDGMMESGSTPYNRDLLGNQQVYTYAWDNVWEWGVAKRAHQLANKGFKVVMAQATHLYFDHPYEPDPEERGLYWATRFTSTRKVFSFMPSDLYANADVKRSGDPLKREDVCGKEGDGCIELTKPENIAGMQGHLWGELIRTRQQADHMLFPRLLALAERAWHEPAWERQTANQQDRESKREADWANFANTLGYRELAKLDRQGVEYRVPPPGAILSDGKLLTNVPYPGLRVEFSQDGGTTWCQVSDDVRVTSNSTILLRTRSASGVRYSRVVTLQTSGIKANLATSTGVACLVTTLLLFAFSYLQNICYLL